MLLTVFSHLTVSAAAGHQMTIYVPTSPNVCFCITWSLKHSNPPLSYDR